mmetsp:Transcript_130251/g.337828  ORF Transcript_130251/g.337828 Transcript_130251/m.337828 type:complete len:189 (-) Transcript_130251:7-573(-)
MQVTAVSTGEEVSCDVGIVVHPVNSPPSIVVDEAQLIEATGGRRVVRSHEDIFLAGVYLLADPDEEGFGDWFGDNVHTARLHLEVSCGSLSFGRPSDRDYAWGVQNGSIAGTEGLTFYAGDGSKDPRMEISSTLNHLNVQLRRLYYHSGGGCRGKDIRMSLMLDDLGNYGAGGPLQAHAVATWKVLPT